MAERAQQLTRAWPGIGAAIIVAALTLGTVVAILARSGGSGGFGPADWSAIRFTLVQAILSALLSTVLAIPISRALSRRNFPGRRFLVLLLAAPFILPVIVAVLGILAVFGRSGLFSDLLLLIGMGPIHIYGLQGVVLAHVFFNLPLATRLLLQGWQAVPAERFRLAASLGFRPADVQRVLEWPMLRQLVPGIFVTIFVICTTSFAVALTLGGGPRATTVELAIYQAFRFDFDLTKVAQLAGVQFSICAVAAILALWTQLPQMPGGGQDRPVTRHEANGLWLRVQDALLIFLAALFLILPLLMVVLDGLAGLRHLDDTIYYAAGRSVIVAAVSSLLSVSLGLAMAIGVHAARGRLAGKMIEGTGYLAIAASPLVIGTGLFIMIFPIANPSSLALYVTALVNAVMALPFVLRSLIPSVSEVELRFGPLADSLGMKGLARFRLLLLPRIRRPLGFAAGLAAALSMGDLGVVALFVDPDQATLPLQMYRLMSAYRMEAAAGAGLLLLGLSLMAFWILDLGARADVDS